MPTEIVMARGGAALRDGADDIRVFRRWPMVTKKGARDSHTVVKSLRRRAVRKVFAPRRSNAAFCSEEKPRDQPVGARERQDRGGGDPAVARERGNLTLPSKIVPTVSRKLICPRPKH